MLKILAIILAAAMSVSMYATARAQDKDEKPSRPRSVKRAVTGTISGIGLAKDFIAVEYQKDDKEGRAYEVAVPLGKNVSLVHIKKIEDLKVGDTVSVEYEDAIEADKEGRDRSLRRGRSITFLKPAPPPKPEPAEPEEPEQPEQTSE